MNSYQQVRPFSQSSAGRVPDECLENTRKGYGINAKYADAWLAWESTDQHTGAVPTGVAVPVFFSYEGPTNGHVGVQLASGEFWSDGTVYASIAAFEASHTPRYVGWSTSLDGVPVIGQSTPTNEVVVRFKPGTWNVRTGQSTSATILGTVRGNQEATVVIQPSGWGQLTFVGQTAYVGPTSFVKV